MAYYHPRSTLSHTSEILCTRLRLPTDVGIEIRARGSSVIWETLSVWSQMKVLILFSGLLLYI